MPARERIPAGTWPSPTVRARSSLQSADVQLPFMRQLLAAPSLSRRSVLISPLPGSFLLSLLPSRTPLLPAHSPLPSSPSRPPPPEGTPPPLVAHIQS